MTIEHPQERFMKLAIEEGIKGASQGKYAVGAVVVDGEGKVIASEHATVNIDHDATAHAEVNAIRAANKLLQNRYLPGCWLYTTLEPCPMCTGAAIWAKVEGVVFGATMEDSLEFAKGLENKKFTWRQIMVHSQEIISKADPKPKLVEGFMREECNKLFEFAKND